MRAVADDTSAVDNFLDYLKASIVSPGFFPPVVTNNMTLADGTVISTANMPEAIETCREIVDNDEGIILDLIMVQEGNFPSLFSEIIGERLQESISFTDVIQICKS